MTYRLKSHLWNGVTELHEDKPYATIGELCDATVALLQDFPAIAVPRLTLTMVIPTGKEYQLGPDALRRCCAAARGGPPARRASHQTANIAQRAHQDGHLLLQHLHLHLRQAETEQSLRVLDLLPLLL